MADDDSVMADYEIVKSLLLEIGIDNLHTICMIYQYIQKLYQGGEIIEEEWFQFEIEDEICRCLRSAYLDQPAEERPGRRVMY